MTWGRVRFESSGKTPRGEVTLRKGPNDEKPICKRLGPVLLDGRNSTCKGPEAEQVVV